MSISSVKTNGYNYLNNSFTSGSVLGNLISGSARANATNGTGRGGTGTGAGAEGASSSSNLDLKQQVADTCESFEVSICYI